MSGRTFRNYVGQNKSSLSRTVLWFAGWDSAMWLLTTKWQLQLQIIAKAPNHHTFAKRLPGGWSPVRTSLCTPWSYLWFSLCSATGRRRYPSLWRSLQSIKALGSYLFEAAPVVHSSIHSTNVLWAFAILQILLQALRRTLRCSNNNNNSNIKIPALMELILIIASSGSSQYHRNHIIIFFPEGSEMDQNSTPNLKKNSLFSFPSQIMLRRVVQQTLNGSSSVK